MIGLKRGTVKLEKYNPKWKKAFEVEEKRLKQKFGNKIISIEHIGSTSIPGISAKPIIDILIGVKSMKDVKKYIKLIENAGYVWRPKFGRLDRHIVFAKGSEVRRTHYLHLAKYNGKKWQNDLLFRDYLRTHKKYMLHYESLKTKLAKKYADDRVTYTAHKDEFINMIIGLSRHNL